MIEKVLCDHPRIILNPRAPELIYRYKHFVYNGSEIIWKGSFARANSWIPYRYGLKKSKVLDYSNGFHYVDPVVDPLLIQNSYIYSDDGEIFPLYIQVPCGHCPNCIMSKQYSFVQRCLLETQSHNYWPWFVTLTYKDRYIPFSRQLCVRDVQNFLKRFRILLERKYNGRYNGPLRYAVCGEYGKLGRCHFHLILWGIKSLSARDFANVRHLIRFAWSKRISHIDKSFYKSCQLPSWLRSELREFDFKRELIGFVSCRAVNPDDDDKTFKYTTKYMCKPIDLQHLPFVGAKRPFINSSRSRSLGSIGKPYLLSILPNIDKSGFTKPLYVNKFSRKVKNLYTNKWVIDCLFPGKFRKIPSFVRKSFLEMSFHSLTIPIDTFYNEILSHWRIHFYDPFFIDPGLSFKPEFTLNECYYNISIWMERLNLHSPQDIEEVFQDADLSQVNRDLFLFGLFSNQEDLDVSARSYKAALDQARQISLEVL